MRKDDSPVIAVAGCACLAPPCLRKAVTDIRAAWQQAGSSGNADNDDTGKPVIFNCINGLPGSDIGSGDRV